MVEKEEFTARSILIDLLQGTLPTVCGIVFVFLVETVNIIFIGQLDDATLINGVGMGTLYCNFTGYILGLGLIGALDTKGSQSYGSGNYKTFGVFLNTTRVFVCLTFFVVCCPLSIFSNGILLALNQDPEVANIASTYIWTLLPALFFDLNYDIQMRYLQAMTIFTPPMIINFFTFLIHPIWCYIFIFWLEMGVVGAGIAFTITQFLNLLIISMYIQWANPCPESYFPITSESLEIERIKEFASLALPSAFLMCSDWLGFEMLTVFASYLGEASLTANICFFNITSIVFSIPLALSYTGSAFVGNSFGEGEISKSKAYAKATAGIGFVLYTFLCCIIIIFIEDLAQLYTKDKLIQEKLVEVFSYYAIFSGLDSFQVSLIGVVKGIGKQGIASLVCLIVMFPINVPMCYFIGFYLKKGLIGLWYAQTLSFSFLGIIYSIICFITDWEKLSAETIKTITEEEIKLQEE